MKLRILGLALISLMGLSAAKAAESPTLILGNGYNKTVSYQSVTSTDTVGSALHYTADEMMIYEGCQLTEVHVDLGTLTGNDSVRVFVSSSLTGKPLYEGKHVQQKTGWNTFTLPTPLTLDGQELFIGYEVTGTRMLRYSNPLVKGEEWLRKNNEKGWQRYGDIYAASLYATLTGNVPRRNLVMGDVVMPFYAKTGEPMAFSGQFVNLGADTIRTVSFSLLLNGTPTATQTVDGLNVLPRKRGYFTLDQFSVASEGDYQLRLEASAVNSGEDASAFDNCSRTVGLLCRDQFTKRKVLMEVFSTEKCTGCPAGHRTINNVMGDKTDLIEIGHHAGYYTDTFTVAPSVDYEWFYKAHRIYAPAVMFDRSAYTANYPTAYSDSVAIVGVETGNLNAGYTESAATPAYVDLQLTPTWDEATRKLSVTVDGSQLLSLPQPDSVRLNVVLTEDSVFSTTQRNSEGSFYHRYVLRQVLTGTWGDPVDVANGFTQTFETTLPTAWNEARINVVAFVANYDSTDKTNCRVYNTAEESLAHHGASAIQTVLAATPQPQAKLYVDGPLTLPDGIATLTVYDLQGRPVARLNMVKPTANLPRGLYIIR